MFASGDRKRFPSLASFIFTVCTPLGNLVLGFVDSKLFLALLGFGLLPLLL